MHKKKVWRYYCDFCGKGGCDSGHAKKHELHCTLNPNRICGLCKRGDTEQQPMDILIATYESGGIKELLDKTEGCPACTLAGIRQCKKAHPENDQWDDWNYKKALADFWHEVNKGGI